MTVTEYVAKFNELAYFASTIVPNDDARIRKFMLRLIVEIANLSRPGLVFQRAAIVIKYYYYYYSNFTSDFFLKFTLTCSNYTCISLVKHISTSVLLQLGNSHI